MFVKKLKIKNVQTNFELFKYVQKNSKQVSSIFVYIFNIETNLDSFEANWILELDHALDPSLHVGSPNHELCFEIFIFFFEFDPIDFLSKTFGAM